MRRFGFLLNGVVAVSFLLAAFAMLGGLDWLAQPDASTPLQGRATGTRCGQNRGFASVRAKNSSP